MEELNTSAGDVIIEEAYITSGASGSTEIKNFIMEFDIYMDVLSNTMTAYFQIADGVGLITAIPITGQEALTIKFKTPGIDDSFHRTFIIHSVSNRALRRDREQYYTLECISPEGQDSTASVLTQKFKGSTDEICLEIFDELTNPRIIFPDEKKGSNSSIEIIDTPHSSNNFEFISNHWSAFKCLNFIASRSRGATLNKTNFMFFERKDAYFFGPLEFFISQAKQSKTIYDEFTKVESQEQPIYDDVRSGSYSYISPYISSRYHTIKTMKSDTFKSLLLGNIRGFHSQSINSYDFVTKTLLTMKYDNRPESKLNAEEDRQYINESFDDFETMGDINVINEGVISNPLAHKTFTPMATSPYGSSYSRGIAQVRNQLIRNFSMVELENNVIEITVPGKADVDLGFLVRLIYPKSEEKTAEPDRDDLEDPYVSGLYMIVGIRHKFQVGKHDMVLRLMRDSLGG